MEINTDKRFILSKSGSFEKMANQARNESYLQFKLAAAGRGDKETHQDQQNTNQLDYRVAVQTRNQIGKDELRQTITHADDAESDT